MRNPIIGKILAQSVLLIGILSTILGGGVLFSSASGASRLAAVPASLCLASGVLLIFIVVKLHRRSRYFFLASFLILTGLLMLCIVSGLVPYSLFRLWPLLTVFVGLSLIPAGLHRYGGFRARFVVPTLAFIVLGTLFLFFSFKFVPFSFSRFLLDWWPLLLALAGVLLLLVSLSAQKSDSEESDS